MIMRYQMELLQEELKAKHGTDNAPIDLKQNIRDAKYNASVCRTGRLFSGKENMRNANLRVI